MKLSHLYESKSEKKKTKKKHSWPKGGGKICQKGLDKAKSAYDGKWSAYAAGYATQVCKGQISADSKESNGPSISEKKEGGLSKWFKEKWVDISTTVDGKHPPCGRSGESDRKYPKCRPSRKVKGTKGKTAGEMSKGEKKAATKRKRAVGGSKQAKT